MLSIGPGRNSATIAARSRTEVGRSSLTYRRMPGDSSWKMPVGLLAAAAGLFSRVRSAERCGDRVRLVEPDAELVRHHLGDPVDLAVAEAEDTPDIPDGRAGEHRPEGDDLGHAVRAVLPRDVGDDLVPSGVLEVDVDVGHRHAARVEEALKGQLVADRINRG